MDQLVSVDATNGFIVVSSYVRTDDGMWIIGEHAEGYPEDLDNELLSQAIVAALSHSVAGVARVPFHLLEPRLKQLQQLAHVSSEKKYMNGAKGLQVSRNPGTGVVTVIPTRNEGKNGFVHLTAKQVLLTADLVSSPAALGEQLRTCFSMCE